MYAIPAAPRLAWPVNILTRREQFQCGARTLKPGGQAPVCPFSSFESWSSDTGHEVLRASFFLPTGTPADRFTTAFVPFVTNSFLRDGPRDILAPIHFTYATVEEER